MAEEVALCHFLAVLSCNRSKLIAVAKLTQSLLLSDLINLLPNLLLSYSS